MSLINVELMNDLLCAGHYGFNTFVSLHLYGICSYLMCNSNVLVVVILFLHWILNIKCCIHKCSYQTEASNGSENVPLFYIIFLQYDSIKAFQFSSIQYPVNLICTVHVYSPPSPPSPSLLSAFPSQF